jgi:putative hydrolase of the HAD superfamily
VPGLRSGSPIGFRPIAMSACACFPDAHNVIDALRARGTRLALVTNGASEAQRAKIDRFDLANRFDHFQIEGEHEFGKPDERT